MDHNWCYEEIAGSDAYVCSNCGWTVIIMRANYLEPGEIYHAEQVSTYHPKSEDVYFSQTILNEFSPLFDYDYLSCDQLLVFMIMAS